MAAFSYSRIGSYENCQLQYKYQYIDRIKVETEDTVETFLGGRVHEALEKLYRHKMYEKLMTLEELIAYYNKIWEENWKDSVIIVKEEYTQENYRKIGERQLKDYYESHKPFDGGKILGLETKKFLSLDEGGEYKFHIRIDRLMDMGDGIYEVHDYKTGGSLDAQADLDKNEQLAMYSLWVREEYKDCKDVRLVWHFTNFDKEMESWRTPDQLEELRMDILGRIHKIEVAEEFEPNVSHLCHWCAYKKEVCPMWKHGEELEKKPENEYLNDPGLKLVDEYVRVRDVFSEYKKEAEEKLGKIKEALIEFCNKGDVQVVFGSDKKITVKEEETFKFPGKGTVERGELVDLLKSMNKFDLFFDLDVHGLKKVIEKKEWDESDLEMVSKYIEKDLSYRLSVGKKE
ncbi:MAG: PD-(D/E)XK nuclease family protein [Candidatus Bathyarchaeia archaeon]